MGWGAYHVYGADYRAMVLNVGVSLTGLGLLGFLLIGAFWKDRTLRLFGLREFTLTVGVLLLCTGLMWLTSEWVFWARSYSAGFVDFMMKFWAYTFVGSFVVMIVGVVIATVGVLMPMREESGWGAKRDIYSKSSRLVLIYGLLLLLITLPVSVIIDEPRPFWGILIGSVTLIVLGVASASLGAAIVKVDD